MLNGGFHWLRWGFGSPTSSATYLETSKQRFRIGDLLDPRKPSMRSSSSWFCLRWRRLGANGGAFPSLAQSSTHAVPHSTACSAKAPTPCRSSTCGRTFRAPWRAPRRRASSFDRSTRPALPRTRAMAGAAARTQQRAAAIAPRRLSPPESPQCTQTFLRLRILCPSTLARPSKPQRTSRSPKACANESLSPRRPGRRLLRSLPRARR